MKRSNSSEHKPESNLFFRKIIFQGKEYTHTQDMYGVTNFFCSIHITMKVKIYSQLGKQYSKSLLPLLL
jgi:plastocyanin